MRKQIIISRLLPFVLLAATSGLQANDMNPGLNVSDSGQSMAPTGTKRSIIDFHIGPTVANMSVAFTGNEQIASRLGLSTGIGIDLLISKGLSFNPEINYVQRGFSIRDSLTRTDGSTVSLDGSANLGYIEVPLLLKTQLKDGPIRPHVMAGPAFGILVSSSNSATATSGNVTESRTEEVPSGIFRSLDYGVQLGAGAEFGASEGTAVLAGFRYYLGLATVNAQASDGVVKNRAMTFNLGFKL